MWGIDNDLVGRKVLLLDEFLAIAPPVRLFTLLQLKTIEIGRLVGAGRPWELVGCLLRAGMVVMFENSTIRGAGLIRLQNEVGTGLTRRLSLLLNIVDLLGR